LALKARNARKSVWTSSMGTWNGLGVYCCSHFLHCVGAEESL
jgi:hypothetical protein